MNDNLLEQFETDNRDYFSLGDAVCAPSEFDRADLATLYGMVWQWWHARGEQDTADVFDYVPWLEREYTIDMLNRFNGFTFHGKQIVEREPSSDGTRFWALVDTDTEHETMSYDDAVSAGYILPVGLIEPRRDDDFFAADVLTPDRAERQRDYSITFAGADALTALVDFAKLLR